MDEDGIERIATIGGEDNLETAELQHDPEHGSRIAIVLGHDDEGAPLNRLGKLSLKWLS
jgi:hypothetical protein